ncbi:MAG TPA: FMN-binding protein [Tissierellia bacterium]|jgi:uncharacterized protein with FMN-binding domain|nr:FMN-binding protein [Tissierellia bacterium]
MKKLALIVCIMMLISMVACTTDDGNLDNNNNGSNIGNDIEDDMDDVVDDIQDGANADNNDNADEKTLTGTAQGYGGEVRVTVKVSGDRIVSVEAVGENETEGVGTRALEELPDKIVEANSTDVDSVSGATMTSEAIKQAVDEALEGNK